LQLRIHIDAITTEFCRNGRAFHKTCRCHCHTCTADRTTGAGARGVTSTQGSTQTSRGISARSCITALLFAENRDSYRPSFHMLVLPVLDSCLVCYARTDCCDSDSDGICWRRCG
jgi:hypothetical protein